MLTRNHGTYWTFTIIGILTAGVLGYVGGYWMKSQETTPVNTVVEQPDVQANIFNQLITEATAPEVVSTESGQVAPASPIHTFTGYIRSLSSDTINIENPDVMINGTSTYTFTLEESTQYFKINTIIVNNQLDYETHKLTAADIAVGDIVSVYTPEDIQTADVRFAGSVELIAKAAEDVEEQY